MTIESRKKVMAHPKFKEIFEPYTSAIGIDQRPQLPDWEIFSLKYPGILPVDYAQER